MPDSGEQPPAAGSVRFAPRLTEDSLPVTLPKDATQASEATTSSDQVVVQTSQEDRRVSAGVLDLQLVPQVRHAGPTGCNTIGETCQHLQCLLAAQGAADQASAAATVATTEGC